jgi:hypothetical protein
MILFDLWTKSQSGDWLISPGVMFIEASGGMGNMRRIRLQNDFSGGFR